MNIVEKIIAKAESAAPPGKDSRGRRIPQPSGQSALAAQLRITVQAVQGFKKQGYFPLGRAHTVSKLYDVPLRDLVSPSIRDAIDASSR